MKALKIIEDNASAIESALLEANGKAITHAFTTFAEIEGLAKAAELKLESLSIAKSRRQGAVYSKISGEAVSNAYARKAFTRAATSVKLERRASGWYLIHVAPTTVWKIGGGKGVLTVTKTQAEEAMTAFKSTFLVKQD